MPCRGPTTPIQDRFGLLRFRSPLLSESLLFSSPPGTKMFQFPGLPSHGLCIHPRMSEDFPSDGLPHSEIPGSLPVYDSPRRFAVFCVLLPLCMPRHPPYALFHLIMPAIYDEFINSTFLRTVNCLFQLSVNLFYNFSERPILLCLSSLFSFQRTTCLR